MHGATLRAFLACLLLPTYLPLLLTPLPAHAQDLKELAAAGSRAVVVLQVVGGSGRELGLGTGFFVSDSIIATNFHVVENAAQLKAVLEDGSELPVAGVVAWDQAHDLALLRVARPAEAAAGYQGLPLADDPVAPGEDVVVIGNPLGYSHTLSTGVVAAVREGDERALFAGEVIQITAAISSGSSGSPVMNLDGEVVAVVASTSLRGQNLNFAVPVARLRHLMEQAEASSLVRAYDDSASFVRMAYLRNVALSLLFFGAVYWGYRKLR